MLNLPNQTETLAEFSLQEKMMQMVMGFKLSQCIFVATELDIAGLLEGGARSCDDLALATNTHANSLYRLLRTLASVGIFSESKQKHFSLNPLAYCLLKDGPASMHNFILSWRDLDYPAWGNLLHTMRTGKSAFENVHGMPRYQYIEQNPVANEHFHRAMKELSAARDDAITAAYDFSSIDTLVDVGGGTGSLLAAVLRKYPNMTGVLFERPEAIEKAQDVLEKADVIERCELVAGDFLEEIPAGNGYLLRNVINTWDDENAIKILRNCRQAIIGQGWVFLIQTILAPEVSWTANFIDLNMLVMSSSGRVRTKEEVSKLYEAAGFQLTNIIPTRTIMSLIEGRAT
uniref:Dimerisation domain-containing protein n=1 Tax=Candidatus Kentrum sp. FW TaxID=2126338 RepID=A0A450SFS6_9GAMM|nr:MAG: Dimerisation domain-containing protein [Candidatus Kentron sp. FW]